MPKSPAHDTLLSRRILILSNLLRRSAGLRYRRLLDISVAEWAVVGELGAHAPVSLNELAAGLALDKTRLSRTVTGLVGRGLVVRRANPADNREQRISLSAAGRRVHAAMMASAQEANETLLAAIPAAGRATLFRTMDELIGAASAMLAAERAADEGARTRPRAGPR